MNEIHIRQIDRWMKWVAILGPMISGLVFGIVGFMGGFVHAKETLLADGHRIELLEGWKDKQEDFNQRTVSAISRLKALIKDTQP